MHVQFLILLLFQQEFVLSIIVGINLKIVCNRPGASSGVLLGAVTLPGLLISKLVQTLRAKSLNEVGIEGMVCNVNLKLITPVPYFVCIWGSNYTYILQKQQSLFTYLLLVTQYQAIGPVEFAVNFIERKNIYGFFSHVEVVSEENKLISKYPTLSCTMFNSKDGLLYVDYFMSQAGLQKTWKGSFLTLLA